MHLHYVCVSRLLTLKPAGGRFRQGWPQALDQSRSASDMQIVQHHTLCSDLYFVHLVQSFGVGAKDLEERNLKDLAETVMWFRDLRDSTSC